jgi:hypothetical protein
MKIAKNKERRYEIAGYVGHLSFDLMILSHLLLGGFIWDATSSDTVDDLSITRIRDII